MGFFSSIGNFFKDSVGSVLGTAGKVVGGILGNNSAERINDQNNALAQAQFQFQKDYAQNRLQWAVEDAKKAGLHPMTAVGLSGASFSPVSTSSVAPDFSWVGDIGQNLDYAATKAKTTKQQAEAFQFQKETHALQLESLQLDNELKQMEIMSQLSRLTQTGPSSPELNTNKPNDRFPSDSSFIGGTIPLLGAARLGNSVLLHYNPEIADAISEDKLRSIVADVAATGQMFRLMPELAKKFTREEQLALKRGDAELKAINPYQIQILYHSRFKPRKDSPYQYSGKITPF